MHVRPAVFALAFLAVIAGVWLLVHSKRAPDPQPARLPARSTDEPSAAIREAARAARLERAQQLAEELARVEGWMAQLGGAGARDGEALLRFATPAALRGFLQRAADAGLQVMARADALGFVRVRYADADALRRELLDNAADYAEVGANLIMQIPEPPAAVDRSAHDLVPLGNRLREFLGVGSDAGAWGRGVKIAILDTGVAADATFGTGRLRSFDIGLGTAVGRGSDDGHGTAVAALAAGAAADAQGVAPEAAILSFRVTGADGRSDVFTVAQAIVAAVDQGAQIVNVSLGTWQASSVLSAAIGYAGSRGAVVVAAAGNSQATQLEWPAADPRVVSVGAVDALGQQATFSNSGEQLRLTAPGYAVQTAWLDGQRVLFNGTSGSAPIVAGAIAALMSQTPGLGATEAASLLEQFASEAGPAGADPDYGRGILNLGWAMARRDYARVDTAIASHTYDTATGTLGVVVQNRSARSVAGLRLVVESGGAHREAAVAWLEPGATAILDFAVLRPAAGAEAVTVRTELLNASGVFDAVPANNSRTSVLSAPARAP